VKMARSFILHKLAGNELSGPSYASIKSVGFCAIAFGIIRKERNRIASVFIGICIE
jgi:hypothetical protein